MRILLGVFCCVLVTLTEANLNVGGVSKTQNQEEDKKPEKLKISNEYRTRLHSIDLKCVAESNVDLGVIAKARSEGILNDTPETRKFVHCLGKKFNVIDLETNKLKTDVITRIAQVNYGLSQSRIDTLIETCVHSKEDVENTLFEFYKCLLGFQLVEY